MQNLPLSGYKTLIFALLLGAVGAAQTFDWATIVPAADVGPVMMGLAALVAILRALTSTPVGK